MSRKVADGGYYAIKGFLYQFDKTILDALNKPDTEIEFEQDEDINYENYVIQVKHKETQNFSLSKLKQPVIKLMNLFIKNRERKFRLYCYFRDKSPSIWKLTLDELDRVLGNEKGNFELEMKKKFVENFCIEFSSNFEEQFKSVLNRIKENFGLENEEEALYHHAIIRSELLQLATQEKPKRKTNKSTLESMIKNVRSIIFHTAYAEYLGKEKFEKFIRKTFFTAKDPNINNFQRLFVIDYDGEINLSDLIRIVSAISGKYFRECKSPAPYICIRRIDQNTLNKLKQDLLDSNKFFSDGTFFDGDKFRLEKLIGSYKLIDPFRPKEEIHIRLKFINEEKLKEHFKQLNIKEIYQFFLEDWIEFDTPYRDIHLHIEETEQILKYIGG